MSMSFDFSGRTVLVTGAGRGIGEQIARTFLIAGAHVVAADVDDAVVRERFADFSTVIPVACDVAQAAQAELAVGRAVEETGRLDVVVNNAGITRDAAVWKMTDEQWNAVLAVHLNGTFNFTRSAVPVMRERGFGRIINVTSYTGLHGNFGQANYAAAKAGIIGFSKTVAKEVARFGITVNVLSPNAETPMVAAIPPDKKAELIRQIPMGRFGEPAEMAAAVAFLASEDAGYITGAVLPVDGGLSM